MLRTDYSEWKNLWEDVENVVPIKKIIKTKGENKIQQTVTGIRRMSEKHWW